jgi:hypothetical protein
MVDSRPKVSFCPDGSTNPRNYRWLFVFVPHSSSHSTSTKDWGGGDTRALNIKVQMTCQWTQKSFNNSLVHVLPLVISSGLFSWSINSPLLWNSEFITIFTEDSWVWYYHGLLCPWAVVGEITLRYGGSHEHVNKQLQKVTGLLLLVANSPLPQKSSMLQMEYQQDNFFVV